jgi:2-polyprenyl-3-methyl-5-hydroxy-6-metoxy-1,4-benzoquinol methylase
MTATAEIQTLPAPDEGRVAAFEARLTTALNEAALIVMLSVGHRTGLFEALDGAPPMTPAALAAAAGLHERYVREWLGAMVVARVVELDDAAGTYRLPPEHGTLLTWGGAANLAATAQCIPVVATVEDDIVRCFRDGGGVPYERYDRFHEVMADDSAQTVLPALFDGILRLVPGLTERLTAGIRVLDLGCGRGRALLALAEAFPASTFEGYDLSAEAIGWAEARAREAGLANLSFAVRDLGDFDRTALPAAYDLVTTFDAVHDQAQPLAMLKGIRRTLAPDGVYLAQDIQGSSHHAGDRDHPLGTLLYALSVMHCTPVSLAQGGEGLGTMWGRETAERYFRTAGFGSVEVHTLPHDVQNYYYVCRP